MAVSTSSSSGSAIRKCPSSASFDSEKVTSTGSGGGGGGGGGAIADVPVAWDVQPLISMSSPSPDVDATRAYRVAA